MYLSGKERMQKYPRIHHLPWSPGASSDDRVLSSTAQFDGKNVVVTEKVDGENTSIYSNGCFHARSIDGRFHAPTQWPIRGIAGQIAGHSLQDGE